MRNRDICIDVAAILHPIPQPEPGDDGWRDLVSQELAEERHETIESLRASWEHNDQDPLISALIGARIAKEQAEEEIRHLIAYGREFVQPRPYTLSDLAAAAGMSVSGVRTSYQSDDVDAVAAATGARCRDWRAPDPTPESEDPT